MDPQRLKPVVFEWDGEHMVPLPRFDPLCNRQYVVGETYALGPISGRSEASHSHYFASIQEGFDQLPHAMQQLFETPDNLRKHALIRAGHHNKRFVNCDSARAARQVAALISAFAADRDEYAIVDVEGTGVAVYTAQSQSHAAMPDKKQFEQSKTDVLGYISGLIGVRRSELQREAGRSA